MAGLNAAQKTMDVTSNNMSNANTVGFKRSFASFGDVFSNDPAANPKTSIGSGVLTTAITRDTTAGALKTTGRVTDMAIDGRGFFVVRDPATTGDTFSYTRAGNFGLDFQGFMIDPSGNQVIGYKADASGKFDANGKAIMAPVNEKIALKINPQFANGEILPDGTIAGQETQLVSIQGPAAATGSIVVAGVNVPLRSGMKTDEIANKVASDLANAFQVSNPDRTVSVVGTGEAAQVKIVFGAKEGDVNAVTVDTPLAAGGLFIPKSPFQQVAEVQTMDFSASPTNNTGASTNIVLTEGSTTITIPVADGANYAQTVQSYLSNSANVPTFAGRSVAVDATNPDMLSIEFGNTEGLMAPIGILAADALLPTTSVETQAGNYAPKISEFGPFSAATADATINVAGVSVNVAAGESATTITNHVVTAMQSAFPSRNIVANGDKISMTYALAEGDGPPVMLKVTNKKPATGTSLEAVKGSLDPVLMQGLSISPKGEVMATYTNGSIYTMGFVAIATFPNEGGLKDVGGNRFVETGDSGGHTITPAGAPKAGNIMSGALEQANVDITSELMEMIRAQQVYNGNARVLQTTVDTVTKITDMR